MSTPGSRRRLARLYDEQNGLCCYCDGQTWLPSRVSKETARILLGIPKFVPGTAKMLRAAKATQEHIKRIAEGGTVKDGMKMACQACNSRRDDSPPDVHRIDMQVLAAAGLHPTNRPKVVDDPLAHIKRGLKALKKLRAGKPIEEPSA